MVIGYKRVPDPPARMMPFILVQSAGVQSAGVQSSKFKVQKFKVHKFKVQEFKVLSWSFERFLDSG